MNQSSVVFAAGCFWGVEELIRQVKGVLNTEVGYSGGSLMDARYEMVKTGRTGHAESVRVEFDPGLISLKELLELFFKLHDPTTLNRQGNDVGNQYRSAIFYADEEQKQIASTVILEQNQVGRWAGKVATTIEPLTAFYPAEDYHQDYLQRFPEGYTCHFWRS